MMRVTYYLGCFTPTKQYALEKASKALFETLSSHVGIRFEPLPNAACCGHPIKCIKPDMWIYLAGRILALAETTGSDILLPLCNGCYLSVREAKHVLDSSDVIMSRVNDLLREEGLKYTGRVRVVHAIELFHDYITPKRIRELVKGSVMGNGLRAVTQYGCHALRPKYVPTFDNPSNPQKFENIIEALGVATIRDYPGKLECCGAPLMASDPELGLRINAVKLKYIAESGADLVVTTCPYCFEMLDSRQEAAARLVGENVQVPVMYYQQLLGLALGLDEDDLALNLNMSPVGIVLEKVRA